MTPLIAGVGLLFLVFGIVVFVGAPYVPSLRKDIDKAFSALYVISKKDVLLDIGSGDGKVLRAAASRGAKSVGYEINPVLVAISRLMSLGNNRIDTQLQNMWTARFPDDLTVIYIFAVSRDAAKVATKVQKEVDRIGRPLSLISYGSTIPGGVLEKQVGAHHLYVFAPLQTKKPQV